MRRTALLVTGALIAVGAAALFVPFLVRDRELVALTPAPPAARVVTVFPLAAQRTACLDRVIMDPRSEQARFQVGTYRAGTGPALRVAVRAPGYRAGARVAAGFADNAVLQVPLDPPARPVLASVCITNEGRRRVGLYGSTEQRTVARPTLTIDGRRTSGELALSFYERGQASVASRPGLLLDRMTAFRPGWLGEPVLVVLALLAAVVLPVGAVVAWSRAVGADDELAQVDAPSQAESAEPPMSGTASRGTA